MDENGLDGFFDSLDDSWDTLPLDSDTDNNNNDLIKSDDTEEYVDFGDNGPDTETSESDDSLSLSLLSDAQLDALLASYQGDNDVEIDFGTTDVKDESAESAGEQEGMESVESDGQPDDSDTESSGEESLTEREEEYEKVSEESDFVDESGNVVVMDNDRVDLGDNFRFEYVDINNIAVVKRIRNSACNVEDLVQSIRSTGLLEPVVVAQTMTEGMYVLLAGYRRLLSCAKLGKRNIPCIINLKANVPQIPILEAMYNQSKAYSIQEMSDYIEYLETEKGLFSASLIEYLLQMNPGDYTKLKDLNESGSEDILDKLYSGQLTIEQAFKKLESERKKKSKEEKDNEKAGKVYEDEAESGANDIKDSGESISNSDEPLSDEEISNLTINASNLDDVDDESIEDVVAEGESVEGYEARKQNPKERKPLEPETRKAVLARDNNTCQACKQGGQEFTEVLDVHHITEVYLGGDDSMENLTTLCTVCHKLVHLYGRGDLHIGNLEEKDEQEQARFKRIIKLGTVIRKESAARGIKKDKLKEMDKADTIGRTKPGTGQVAS